MLETKLELDSRIKEENRLYENTAELEAARSAYLAEQEKSMPSSDVKFSYAWVLIKSPQRDNKQRGIGLLKDLIDEGFNPSDCLYGISEAYYALGEYSESRSYCERLLRRDPTHTKALGLHQCLRDVVKDHGAIGLGIAAGAVVMVGVALKYLMSSRSRN